MHYIYKIIFLVTCFGSYSNLQAAGKAAERQMRDDWLNAAMEGKIEVIKNLIDKIDVNISDSHGKSALILAARDGHEEIVKLLLQVPNINVNARNIRLETPLMLAALFGRENIVKLLLAMPDININAENNMKSTALMAAAKSDKQNMLKLLLDAPGIKIDAKNASGKTALNIAFDEFRADNMGLIDSKITELSKKAFVSIKQHDLKTLKSILEQIGDYPCLVDSTLIKKAFEANCPEIISYLLQRAKDPRELLAEIPFEHISPSSELFKYFLREVICRHANSMQRLYVIKCLHYY